MWIILAVKNSTEIKHLCVLRLLWLTENLIYGSQVETVETSLAGCKREGSNRGRV